jgi:hypothetical protein
MDIAAKAIFFHLTCKMEYCQLNLIGRCEAALERTVLTNKTLMLFGDAKTFVASLVKEIGANHD